MSRRYLNDRWCVRCGRNGPTPYLRKKLKVLTEGKGLETHVLDVGCGNCRNMNYLMKETGMRNVTGCDMACKGKNLKSMTLGHGRLPGKKGSVGIILANYVFMFLDQGERNQLMDEICRVAAPGCRLMLELYAAKDSEAKTDKAVKYMQEDLGYWLNAYGWKTLHWVKDRAIFERL